MVDVFKKKRNGARLHGVRIGPNPVAERQSTFGKAVASRGGGNTPRSGR